MPNYICRIKWIQDRGGDDIWEHNQVEGFVKCRVCYRNFPWSKKHALESHNQSVAHQKAKKLHLTNKARQMADASSPPPFAADLAKVLVACSIPVNKVENRLFIQFIEKYTGHVIPSRGTIMKNVESQAKDVLGKIKEKFNGEAFYVFRDEFRDIRGKPVAAIFIGLFRTFLVRPLLVNISETRAQDSEAIANGVIQTIHDVLGADFDGTFFKIFITNNTPHHEKAAILLKERYSELIYGACGTSSMNPIAKKAGAELSSVNRLFSETKRIMKCDKNLPKFSTNVSLAHIKDVLVIQWNADLLVV